MHSHDLLAPIQGAAETQFVSGKGAALIDEKGTEYLDFNEICLVLGQGNESFARKVSQALMGVTCSKGKNPAKERLHQKLLESTHGDFAAIHFTSSGSETAEWAVKLAQKLTGRSEVLSFWNSIHGRTHLSASMSGLSKRKTHYGPLCPGTVFGVYPDCAHCPLHCSPENCGFECLSFLDKKIAMESAQDIAAVIVEPYQGAGVICPPPGYLKALEEWAHARGMLFIMDEVQSGMGRTGSLYVYQKEGLKPDMLLLGKGLGNGLHIGALLTREPVEDKNLLYALSGGSGDDAVACAAACAVFEELEGGLLEHIQETGAYFKKELHALAARFSQVYQVRCQGLACAVEFREEETCTKVKKALQEAHIFVAPYEKNALMLKPPYSGTKEQIGKVVAVMAAALDK